MLGSNLSAVAGDGSMGGSVRQMYAVLPHAFVLNALNPGVWGWPQI
jgi:hypothetical protein